MKLYIESEIIVLSRLVLLLQFIQDLQINLKYGEESIYVKHIYMMIDYLNLQVIYQLYLSIHNNIIIYTGLSREHLNHRTANYFVTISSGWLDMAKYLFGSGIIEWST